ncbi:kinase-like protein [Byssothecium circinans]|uniref:Kinase-like protein n=1 Tax=Byssothecium circinans TaxID=147558 RepID=A0A6A5UFM9_9PLEO|nr:kinase-like protein [Byssothecium circinans]
MDDPDMPDWEKHADFLGDGRQVLPRCDHSKQLGSGTDASVILYEYKVAGHCRRYAVKLPASYADAALRTEIHNLRILSRHRRHPNIVNYLGHDDEFPTEPVGPALFLEYADYGDLHSYCENLFTKVRRMPEVTVWKILLDLTSAIDYIHNGLGENQAYCHSDMKPANILVFFKISDFGRMRPFFPGTYDRFNGTFEYAPPHPERENVDPAIDIWAIAASISFAVFQTNPVENRENFITWYNNDRQVNPGGEKLSLETKLDSCHRDIRRYLYRPLNVPKEQQIELYQVRPSLAVEPYSNEVQHWYQRCYMLEKNDRMTAVELRIFIPRTARTNIALYALDWRQKRHERQKILIENERRRAGREPELPVPPVQGDLTVDYGEQDL